MFGAAADVGVCTASKCYKASNMCVLNPHVHVLGDDSAVIAYTTLTQHLDKSVMAASLIYVVDAAVVRIVIGALQCVLAK